MIVKAVYRIVFAHLLLSVTPVQSDADDLLATVRELNTVAQLQELDEAAVRILSYTAQGDLAPLNAFIGGLAAQEVIKVRSKVYVYEFCF